MKKLLLVLIVLIIIVIIFPKSAGQSGGGMPSPSGVDIYVDKNCSCLGYKYSSNRNWADVPMKYKCIGISHSCECVQVSINKKETSPVQYEITDCHNFTEFDEGN
jgi:hypothetical protein